MRAGSVASTLNFDLNLDLNFDLNSDLNPYALQVRSGVRTGGDVSAAGGGW
jgi:hypothetical protein